MSKLLLEHEAEELAESILGIDTPELGEVEAELLNKFNVDLANFRKIASALLLKTTPYTKGNEDHYCFVERYDSNSVVALARIIVKRDGE